MKRLLCVLFVVRVCSYLSGSCRIKKRVKPKAIETEDEIKEREIVLESEDAYSWVEERREYLAIEADQRVPSGLRGIYQKSYTKKEGRNVKYMHLFHPQSSPIKYYDWTSSIQNDQVIIRLILELLESVSYLHTRGLPHLSLSANSVCINLEKPILQVIGAGAGPSLVATKRPFRVPETFDFNAPETTGATSAIIRSNLRALLLMDAWSVGILIVMLLTSRNQSPVRAKANWIRGFLDDRAAVAHKSRLLFDTNLGSFLRDDLGIASNGLVYRHGWLLQIVLGLLHLDPVDRMSVVRARDIAVTNLLRTATSIKKPFALERNTVSINNQNIGGKKTNKKLKTTLGEEQIDKNRQDAPPQKNELGRFGTTLNVSRSGEPFRSLEAMVNIIEAGGCSCLLQDRSDLSIPSDNQSNSIRKIIPYGEIIGFRNRGDGDRWDIIAPGIPLDHTSPTGLKDIGINNRLTVSGVLGVVLIKGGNHKIVVQLDDFRPASRAAVIADVYRFIDAYVAAKPGLTKARVRFLEYSGESESAPIKPSPSKSTRTNYGNNMQAQKKKDNIILSSRRQNQNPNPNPNPNNDDGAPDDENNNDEQSTSNINTKMKKQHLNGRVTLRLDRLASSPRKMVAIPFLLKVRKDV